MCVSFSYKPELMLLHKTTCMFRLFIYYSQYTTHAPPSQPQNPSALCCSRRSLGRV